MNQSAELILIQQTEELQQTNYPTAYTSSPPPYCWQYCSELLQCICKYSDQYSVQLNAR